MLSKSQILKALVIVFLAVAPCVAQTRAELQRKYYSEDGEHYAVRPGVLMTVSFTGEDRAREIVIEPQREQGKENDLFKGMAPAKLTKIINEVAPARERGRLIREYTFSGGCSEIRTSEYERVTISRTHSCAPSGGGDISATIRWKTS